MVFIRHKNRINKFPIIICILIVIIILQFILFCRQFKDFSTLLCPYSYTIDDKRIIFDSSTYSINHFPEFICPQNFRNMADWVYGWPDNVFDESIQNSINKIKDIVAYLPHGSIIYIKTDSLHDFFSNIYPFFQNKFVLITGQSDLQAPGKHIYELERNDSKIIHWFAQNADINISISKRFTPIPIGINCFEMAESIRGVHKQYLTSILPPMINDSIEEPAHYIQPFDITQNVLKDQGQANKIALLNFDPNTDPTGIRKSLWKDLCENNHSSYAICYTKPPSVDISILPTIYKRNRQYPLWLSPRGNGIDCHRTWEALYLDIIPIVWHSTLDSLYTDLPIIVINNWNEINEEFLRKKLYEISKNKLQQPSIYQYEKLRSAYWHRMILNKSRYASLHNPTKRNRCWRAKSTTT